MTAKEAFRLADSIIRYDARGGFATSFDFDDDRDTLAELAMIPNECIGAAYRARANFWSHNVSWPNLTGRIMIMYKRKQGLLKTFAGREYEIVASNKTVMIEGSADDR